MKEKIIESLKHVFDPEIPVNVYDLGLIYGIEIRDSRFEIRMSLTSPTCPMAEDIVRMVKQAAESVAGTGNAHVELVWDPPWDINKMSDTARVELDLTEQGW
ncbi:MAG: iron-sulfur cluster assembly protein [Rickettsiales bacterium]|jgi:FeS assembly SUF system protein|nr:iron-sulfur cluster assembly protein [Rickettsiales bacterium]